MQLEFLKIALFSLSTELLSSPPNSRSLLPLTNDILPGVKTLYYVLTSSPSELCLTVRIALAWFLCRWSRSGVVHLFLRPAATDFPLIEEALRMNNWWHSDSKLPSTGSVRESDSAAAVEADKPPSLLKEESSPRDEVAIALLAAWSRIFDDGRPPEPRSRHFSPLRTF